MVEDLVVSEVELVQPDILISWIYRLTTGTSPQYSMAAAVTVDYLYHCHLNLYDRIQETTRI